VNILELDRQGLIDLDPANVRRKISIEELFHILQTLDALWLYDYAALEKGKKGYHAELKSMLCGDGFVNLKSVLKEYPNIRKVLAYQLVLLIEEKIRGGMRRPTHIAGVPSAASELGEDVAAMMGLKVAVAIKDDEGRIKFTTLLSENDLVLFVEDLCTKATGIKEAITDAVSSGLVNIASIILEEVVILSRGGLSEFWAVGKRFGINAAFEHRLHEWMPPDASAELKAQYPDANLCPLCTQGVLRLKPKKTDDNWRLITTAQN